MTKDQLPRYLADPSYKPKLGEQTLNNWRRIFRIAFLQGDTTTVRTIMLAASIFKAIGFLPPFDPMAWPANAYMIFMPGWAWAIAFVLHAGGVWWRFTDKPNNLAGFVVNGYGIALWGWTTASGMFALGTYTPDSGMEIAVVLAAFLALYRTGDVNDRLSA